MLNLFLLLLTLFSISTDSMCGANQGKEPQSIRLPQPQPKRKSRKGSGIKELNNDIQEPFDRLTNYFNRIYDPIFEFKRKNNDYVDRNLIWTLFSRLSFEVLCKVDKFTPTDTNRMLSTFDATQTNQIQSILPDATIASLQKAIEDILQDYALTTKNLHELRNQMYTYFEQKRGKDEETINKRKSMFVELSKAISQEKMKRQEESIATLVASLRSYKIKQSAQSQ